jgi:outer membrane protein assembly factor BamB
MRPKPPVSAAAAALVTVLVSLALAPPVTAVSSQSWQMRERDDFETADLTTVALAEDGALSLAPPLGLLYEADQPYLWAIAQDPAGAIYAAGGNDGVIYRIDASGGGREFFRAAEPEVHALAIDRKGRVYAGTAPGGRIYRIEPDGGDASTFETGEQYVWAMAFDDAGNLYAATGTEGRIIRVGQDGEGELLFDSAETHLRALVRTGDGAFLAGSAGQGLIFRVAADGAASVVYDTPGEEVVALAAGPDGTIYAAVASSSRRGGPMRPPQGAAMPELPKEAAEAMAEEEGEAPDASGEVPPQQQQQQQAQPQVRVSTHGLVLVISPDGYGRTIWEGENEVILSLAVVSAGRVLMGSSVEGRLYALDPERDEISVIAEAASGQITALAPRAGADGKGDEVLIAGSNLGTVALLRSGHAPSGTVESPPLDAKSFARWGRISWKADLPRGTAVTFQGRSGNTEDPDRTWSEWGEELTDSKSAVLDLPAARFLQWRAVLETDDPGRTPVLHEVTVSFLQRNLPPEIAQVAIHRAGEQRPGAAPGRAGSRGRPQNPAAAANAAAAAAQAAVGAGPGPEPAVRYIAWNASDPNGDRLSYRVEYRGADESTWKLLKDDQEETFYRLDTTAMPDGTYVVLVTASDAPGNARDEALTAGRLSPHFDVDNTPPRVERLKAELASPAVRLQFTVSDTFSAVRRTAYAVNAGDWVEAHPDDGMNDDLDETYDLMVADLPPGEYSIVVRATDAAGNVGAGKAIVEVP